MAAEGTSEAKRHARRLPGAREAYEELKVAFDAWSESLRTYGNYMAYAVIAANWAIFDSRNALLENDWAKWSLIVAVSYLGVHLAGVAVMTLLHRRRCEYVNADDDRWNREYNDEKRGEAWPYDDTIQYLGEAIRWLHFIAPLASGALLVVGIFRG